MLHSYEISFMKTPMGVLSDSGGRTLLYIYCEVSAYHDALIKIVFKHNMLIITSDTYQRSLKVMSGSSKV